MECMSIGPSRIKSCFARFLLAGLTSMIVSARVANFKKRLKKVIMQDSGSPTYLIFYCPLSSLKNEPLQYIVDYEDDLSLSTNEELVIKSDRPLNPD